MWIIWSPKITWKFSPQALLQWSIPRKNKIWTCNVELITDFNIPFSGWRINTWFLKKYLIQELNCDWINKTSILKVAKRSQSMWGVLKQISFEVTLQALKILFTCTVTLTCGAWPTVPKTEMNNPRFQWNLETNNELNIKIIKFTLFSSQGCLTR